MDRFKVLPQPPIQGVPGSLSLGRKGPGFEAALKFS
jgi:hypothetical protein